MAKFLTTLESLPKIERIIRQAKKEVTIITPYLKLTQIFYNRLREADNRKVNIRFIYGKKEELNSKDLDKIKKLKHLGLYFCKNLHAKCYFNEDLMVITSMNFHEFSQTNNWEMGVLIKLKDDPEIFNNAKKEAISIIQASEIKIDTLKSDIKSDTIQPKIVLDAEEQKLFTLLRSFRYKMSEKENVPAFRVFHDTELKDIARQRPKTKEELLNIKGIANRKYEKYGIEILKIVNDFKS